jgi:hypothetical protein
MATQAERLLKAGLQVDPLGQVDYSQPGIGPTKGNQLANIAPDIARHVVRSAISALPGVGGAIALGKLASTIKPSPDVVNPAQASAMRGPNAPMARIEENIKKVAQTLDPGQRNLQRQQADARRLAADFAAREFGVGTPKPIVTTPVTTTPVTTTPVVKTPVVETPVVETETPVVSTPAVDVGDGIRDLYGELATRDFTAEISQLMADRAANLRGLNAESAARLAQTVARRMTQIGSVETDLAAEIASTEADRLAQQEALAAQVASRATGLVSDTTASLTAAREALGPQVTDEFERVAQLVGSQARSQGMSSQDAMARLNQVANMAAAERLAAPAQLAAEAELALGDEEFALSNQLQENLSTQLASLDEAEAEALLNEMMRQEQFSNQRDRDMIDALADQLVREDTQAFQASQADLTRGFQTSEREAGQEFRTSERIAGQEFSAGQAAAARQDDLMKEALKQSAKAAADALKAKDDASVAATLGIDVSVWNGLNDGAKTALLNNAMEQQILQGEGQFAAPLGTMANFRGKNPGVDPDFFTHLEALYNYEVLGDADAVADAQTAYLDELVKDQGLSGPKGLAPRDIQQIKTLYDAYKRDADIAMAQEARNMRRAQNRILNPPRFNPALTAAMDSGTIGG